MPDSTERDARVDPRFDPLFQRGYDPQKHRTRVKAEPAPHPRVEERREGPRLETPTESPSVPEEREPDPTGADPADLEPLPRNPFRLALLLASLAAIAAAGLTLWHKLEADPYASYGNDIGPLFVSQMTDAVLVPLLSGGIIGLCLWLALGAVRRRADE